MKIVFYISGLGFGHLTRCLAIAEAMLKYRQDFEILFKCTGIHAAFAKRYLAGWTQRIGFENFDRGLHVSFDPKIVGIDMNVVRISAFKWLASLEEASCDEAKTLTSDVSLVISDIVPEAFRAAKIKEIPVVGISNFSWYEVCRIFMTEQELTILHDFYRLADEFLEYPLSTSSELPFKWRVPVGFVARPIDSEKVKAIRRKYCRSGRKLVMLSVGGAMQLPAVHLNEEYDYLCTQGINASLIPNGMGLPGDTLDTQNYIAACDAVVTKCGWSTIAEAMIAGKPIFTLRSETGSWAEEKYLLHNLQSKPYARIIRLCELDHICDEWFTSVPSGFDNEAGNIGQQLLSYARNKS